MSQPQPYAPSTSFLTFQNQQAWFPGPQFDIEFNNLKASITQIEANLALIQRNDGTLATGSVTFLSLDPPLQTAGLSLLAQCVTGTAYTANQVVIQSPTIY